MASFGETLRRERELREISLREISDATKISMRYLEALEQDRFDILPGGLFNKGFIRAYAAYIGVDGEAMVNCYLEQIAPPEAGADLDARSPMPDVHRPARTPRRRAGPAEAAAPVPPGWTREATGPGGATEPAQPAGMTLTGAPLAAEGPAETAPDGGPSRRRPNVLLGVLTIVVVTGAAFVALSLFMPRVPEPERVEVAPAAPGDAPSTAARDAAGEQALAGPAGSVPSPPDAGGTAAARPTSGAAPAATPPPTPPRLPRERPGGTSAGAGSGAAGDARAPAEPVAAPPEPIPAPVSEAAGPMEVHIKATGRTWVQLFCDSDEAINWVMRRGETRRLQCLRSIRVSATDAAAVRLRVNGEPCLPLGEPGSRVYGYTIRFDDYRQICPPEREAHARP